MPQISKAKQMFARLFENMKTRQAPLQVPKASAFFLLGLNLGRRVDPPVTGRIRGRPSPKCCSANWRQRLGVHTAVPNWTGRPPLESAGLHLARWMHRGILIGVDRMRGSLCDRRGMSRFACDEDCRSRIGADLDDGIGQEADARANVGVFSRRRSPSRTSRRRLIGMMPASLAAKSVSERIRQHPRCDSRIG